MTEAEDKPGGGDETPGDNMPEGKMPDPSDAPRRDKDDFREISRLVTGRLRRSFHYPFPAGKALGLILLLVACAWGATGIYRVQPDEQGVVLRFGKWIDTVGPGLHFHFPYPIDRVLFPKVTMINQLQLGNGEGAGRGGTHEKQMLTGDENIVEADCAVFWQIKDAGQYLFKVNDPEDALKMAAESTLRAVIARTPIQAALAEQRQLIADETKEALQRLLDSYQAGILITQVQLQRIDPPSAVIDAFNDVQRARADQERARNEAEAYRNDIMPRARGDAQQITQAAEAYKTQVVDLAQGEVKGFLAVYEAYKLGEEVTAWRLYLDSVDEVLRKATKVIVDSSGKGVSGMVPYLPLPEIKDKAAAPASPQPGAGR
jgi:membrane protease subunit HflK